MVAVHKPLALTTSRRLPGLDNQAGVAMRRLPRSVMLHSVVITACALLFGLQSCAITAAKALCRGATAL